MNTKGECINNIHADIQPSVFRFAGSGPHPNIYTMHQASIYTSAAQVVTY